MIDYKYLFNYLFEESQVLLIRLADQQKPQVFVQEFYSLIEDTICEMREMNPDVELYQQRLDDTMKTITAFWDQEYEPVEDVSDDESGPLE